MRRVSIKGVEERKIVPIKGIEESSNQGGRGEEESSNQKEFKSRGYIRGEFLSRG